MDGWENTKDNKKENKAAKVALPLKAVLCKNILQRGLYRVSCKVAMALPFIGRSNTYEKFYICAEQ